MVGRAEYFVGAAGFCPRLLVEPHRSRQRLPPSATGQPAIVHDIGDRGMLHTKVLGGLISEYRYAA